MPYSVRVNHLKHTITLVCWGDITIDDMMEYERRYWAGTEHEGYHHIVDLQVANLNIDFNEGLMLATHATPGDLDAYAGARSAMVVGNEDQRFLVEAYREARHAMCSPKIREVGVFEDMEKARAWVDAGVVVKAGN